MILMVTDGADTAAIAAAAESRGWCCRAAVPGEALPGGWDVAIVTVEDPALPGRLRESDPGAPRAILALADADWIARHDATALGYDQAVDRARLDADLPAAVADWCHAERLAVVDRLATAFGSVPVARLLEGLRALLGKASRQTADDAALAAEAHRIAGLAGTLGFAALGRAWLRVADDRAPVTEATRRATDHALVTLARAEEKFRSFTAF